MAHLGRGMGLHVFGESPQFWQGIAPTNIEILMQKPCVEDNYRKDFPHSMARTGPLSSHWRHNHRMCSSAPCVLGWDCQVVGTPSGSTSILLPADPSGIPPSKADPNPRRSRSAHATLVAGVPPSSPLCSPAPLPN